MVDTPINQKADRTFRYRGGLLQIDIGSSNTKSIKFVKDMTAELTEVDADEDYVDDGSPVYTPVGDKLGTWSFLLKNSIDLFDSVVPATNQQTASYWAEQIAARDFPTVKFIEVFKAPKSSGNQFGRAKFDGRMMRVKITRPYKMGVEEVEISGDIIAWTSLQRAAS